MELFRLTIHELNELYREKKASPVEVTRQVLSRVEKLDPEIHAYLTVTADSALKEAREAEERFSRGESRGLLDGVPVGLKDIFLTRGVKTTCGSRILENFVPPFDATVVAKLREQGAVFPGKLNMDEFAMGSSTENSGFGPTRNPWDRERVPGGSSGGSAAAVAADECVAALGTDTGGSIRQPASLCGVVGVKPTYGRVSRYGVIAFASSLDQVGPLAKDVEDAAIMLQAVAGHDPRDSTSIPQPVPDYRKSLRAGVKGIRVGLAREYFPPGLDLEVNGVVQDSVRLLEKLGARPVSISLPHTDYAVACYYIIAPAEASSNLARYDGVKYGLRSSQGKGLIDTYFQTRTAGFGHEVKRRIMIGTYTLSSGYYDAYYRKAQAVRTLIRRDFENAFKECDLILTPTSPTPAFKLGEKTTDPLQMYLSDIFTIPVNLAGLPGLSLPGGVSRTGLPIGVHLIGPPLGEEKIFSAAYALESEIKWERRLPEL